MSTGGSLLTAVGQAKKSALTDRGINFVDARSSPFRIRHEPGHRYVSSCLTERTSMIRVSRLILSLLLIGAAAQTASAQLVVRSDHYYLTMLFDAERRPHFCAELDSARG